MINPVRRLELFFLTMLPGLITLALAVFFLAAKHVSGLGHFMPLLPLIPVFYWGMAHAREMPYWFVFILGLVMDAVTGMPLGLSSLMYVLFLLMLRAQRKYIHKEGFVILWGYFALLLATTAILNWSMLSFFYATTVPAGAAIVQWILTVCCYPLLHRLFDGLYEYTHHRRWYLLHGH